MAKAPAYDLSDAEKRDLIALIQAGKPLPERYRFLEVAPKSAEDNCAAHNPGLVEALRELQQ